MYKKRPIRIKKKNSDTNKESGSSVLINNGASVIKKENLTNQDKGSNSTNQEQNVTPKLCTPKRKSIPAQQESPDTQLQSPNTPLQSPGLQSLFPRTFGSPEIEVSWDWGCSQIPKEMLAQRRPKRSQPQPPPFVVPTVPSFYRLPPGRQISEEENQERLAFYKNVLSKSLKRDLQEVVDSKNNNIEKEDDQILVSSDHVTPSKSLFRSGKKEEQINTFFDDSANELMLECSQAIEEKLKNGEIDMGNAVKGMLQNKKYAHSPIGELGNAHKKVCYGRSKLNLFPESSNNMEVGHEANHSEKRHLCLKSPQHKKLKSKLDRNETLPIVSPANGKDCDNNEGITKTNHPLQGATLQKDSLSSENSNHSTVINRDNNVKMWHPPTKLVNGNNVYEKPNNNCNNSNQETVPRRHVFSKQGSSVNENSSNGLNVSMKGHNISNEKLQKVVSDDNIDRVNKFRPVKNINVISNNNNNNVTKPQQLCNNTTKPIAVPNTIPKQPSSGHQCNSGTSSEQDTKLRAADFKSLLDDGLDMELCRLDFDSLCCDGQPKAAQKRSVQPVTKTTPKLCSQQEIEAKRLAALKRLMMKKKR